MKTGSLDLVAAGHICLDITPAIEGGGGPRRWERLFRPGSLSVVGPAAVSTGGAVANVGLAARRLGLAVSLMGKCGDDHLGRTLLAILNEVSPACAAGMRVAPGEPTSYTVVLAVPDSDRVFLHCPGANDTFSAGDVDLELAGRARVFYFGYPPIMARMCADGGGELARLLEAVRRRGVTTALDMALPDPSGPAGAADWRRILAAALPHVDVFAPSVEEIAFMLRRQEYDRLTAGGDILDRLTAGLLHGLAGECLALGGAVVMIKCGRHGLYVRSAGAARIRGMGSAAPDPEGWAGVERFRPAYRVERVVSATGAGDAAVAGFLAGLLRGADLATAADYACAAGAQNVRALDATSGIKTWEQTTADLGSPRVPPILTLD